MSDSQPADGHDVENAGPFPISGSTLFTQWQAQRQAILDHKWIESEKRGYDIGWSAARWDWDMRHRRKWLEDWQERQTAARQPDSHSP